jgi:hypothetical protein
MSALAPHGKMENEILGASCSLALGRPFKVSRAYLRALTV